VHQRDFPSFINTRDAVLYPPHAARASLQTATTGFISHPVDAHISLSLPELLLDAGLDNLTLNIDSAASAVA
jgi:hypothetical protein